MEFTTGTHELSSPVITLHPKMQPDSTISKFLVEVCYMEMTFYVPNVSATQHKSYRLYLPASNVSICVITATLSEIGNEYERSGIHSTEIFSTVVYN